MAIMGRRPGETICGGRPYMYVSWGIRRIGEGEGSPSPGFHIYVAWICLCGSNLQYRRLLWARECFCPRKRHVESPKERRKWGKSPQSPCHKIKDGGYNSTSLNKLSPAQNTPALRVNLVPPFELRLGCRGGLGLHNESDRIILRLASCKQKKVLLRSGEQSEPSEIVM